VSGGGGRGRAGVPAVAGRAPPSVPRADMRFLRPRLALGVTDPAHHKGMFGSQPAGAHGQNVIRRALEKLDPAPPGSVSRYQYWKFQVAPTVIEPPAGRRP
jgi:hypothetical protein